jgi:hypothetical protein
MFAAYFQVTPLQQTRLILTAPYSTTRVQYDLCVASLLRRILVSKIVAPASHSRDS